MNRLLILFLGLCLVLVSCKNESSGDAENAEATADSTTVNTASSEQAPNAYKPGEHIGTIEKLDDGLNKYLNTTTPVEVLANGFEWTEGPLWVSELDALLFSDIPPNKIMKWKEGEGVSLYLTPSGYTGSRERGGEPGSNGLLLDPEGRLVLCQHGDRRIALMDAPLDAPKPKFITLVGSYNDKRFNSPNDAVYDSQGRLYFTDPPYGLEEGIEDKKRELKFQGVFRLGKRNLDLLDNSLSRPNGIALSPDEKTIYIANSDPDKAVWVAYDFNEQGQARNGRFFYDATHNVKKGEVGLPDGMVVAADGTIFATGPGGVWIFSPDATVLGRIKLENPASNCTLGGKDGKTLFITNDMYLLRVRLK